MGAKVRTMVPKVNVVMGQRGQIGYRSVGQAIGKGFNHWGDGDYLASWGNEADH